MTICRSAVNYKLRRLSQFCIRFLTPSVQGPSLKLTKLSGVTPKQILEMCRRVEGVDLKSGAFDCVCMELNGILKVLYARLNKCLVAF